MPSKMENFGFWLSRTFATTKAKQKSWPYVPGTYFVLDSDAPVAVTTLGSVKFAEELSGTELQGVSIIGKVETENVGIEKIIRNVVSNPAIRFLLMVGDEPPKHLTGETFKCLFKNGVDAVSKKIIGSPGMRPMLPTVTTDELSRFMNQVELVDMIGCKDVEIIRAKVHELRQRAPGAFQGEDIDVSGELAEVPVVREVYHDPQKIKLDKAGYFVVNIEGDEILCEHYNYKDALVRHIRGKTARDMYLTMVDNGWISHLDHACYVGKELTKAELSIQHGFEYLQDGA
jgi:tetrahydromethanopterin S-methyltransferase subunit A